MKRVYFYLLLALLFTGSLAFGQNTKGYIINIEEENIYVDLTSPVVSIDDELNVYTAGGYETHPVTKRRVKKNDELVCKITIKSIHAEYSIARTNDSSSKNKLKTGQVVQVMEQVARKADNSLEPIISVSSNSDMGIAREHVAVDERKELTLQESGDRLRHLKSFAKKGTRVFVLASCFDDERFEQVLLNEMGAKGIWKFVNNPQESDFILKVQAISRPYAQFTVTDMYFMVFDKDEQLLWKSNLYFGHKVWRTVNYETLIYATRKYINQALIKDIRKAKNVSYETVDILGLHNVTDKKYKLAEDWYWQGISYFGQYDNKKSVKMFSKAISVNPYHALAYKYRALAFYKQSKFNDARDDILKAMKLDPFCQQNDTIFYSIMIGKNDRFMRIWGPGGTMDRISNVLITFNNALQSVPIANNYSTTVQTHRTTTISSNNTVGVRTCSFCNGTGMNPARERPAFYNHSTEDYSSGLCKICGSNSNHSHKTCPSCNGKGYR